MSSPKKRQWLARNGEVHGPYELPYLLDLNRKGQLLTTDSFCLEGDETWIPYADWRTTYAPPVPQKRTVISSQSGSRGSGKTGKVKVPNPTHLASLPRRPKVTSAAPDPETKADAAVVQDPQRRLFRLAEAINDHRRAHPHKHPFYFAEPQQLTDVAAWLDAHHKGWDAGMVLQGPAPVQEVMHQWFIPAVAFIKPDLVKPSHRSDFGDGRPWRSLEEASS